MVTWEPTSVEAESSIDAVDDDAAAAACDDAVAVRFGDVDAAVGVAAALCPSVLNEGIVCDPRRSSGPRPKESADGILVGVVEFELATIKRRILLRIEMMRLVLTST